ncbi:MAG: FAD:protein FMN transferase [Chitinophagaceae bacterium]
MKNKRTQRLKLLILFVFLFVSGAAQQRYKFTRPKMGSYFTIIFYDNDSTHANTIANKCFAIVDSLNEIYSDYLPTSELNQLCATADTQRWINVSPALFDFINQSAIAWRLSEGSFDISVGPVVRIWRKARKEYKFPDKDSVEKAMQSVGFQFVLIDSVNRKIQLIKPGMQLDPGGIGQGYIGQKVMDYLFSENMRSALVDVSGDIIAGDPPPGKNGWTIAINVPESATELLNKEVIVHNQSIITSGDVYQYLEHDGKRYSHIVDPKTGYGVTNQRNVTVIAADGITADWFTKACTILPLKKIKRLAKKINAEFLIGTIKKEKLRFYASKNFKKYWVKNETVNK